MAQFHTLKIKSVEKVTEHAVAISFEIPDSRVMPLEPGIPEIAPGPDS